MTQKELMIDFFLFGAHFGVDQTTWPFLLLSLIIWPLVFLYGYFYHKNDAGKARIFFFLSATFLFNLLLVLSQDLITFYVFFTLMNFSAIGLIIYRNTDQSKYATKVYTALVILGELIILPAIWLISVESPTLLFSDIRASLIVHEYKLFISSLLFFGFAIKAGLFPLHVWLPLAHPVAPTPASSVLSAILVKAAPLAWLQFFDFYALELSILGQVIIVMGLFSSFYAAVMGIFQSNIKSALAYSTVSQMGLIISILGAMFVFIDITDFLTFAFVAYVFHHGLIKSLLFLGDDLKDKLNPLGRRFFLLCYAFLLLSLSGVFLSTGYFAKGFIKVIIELSLVESSLNYLLYFSLTAVTTTALVTSIFVKLLQYQNSKDVAVARYWIWVFSFILLPLIFWFCTPTKLFLFIQPGWTSFIESSLFIALGAVFYFVLSKVHREIPRGDIVILFDMMIHFLIDWANRVKINLDIKSLSHFYSYIERGIYFRQSYSLHKYSISMFIIVSVMIYLF